MKRVLALVGKDLHGARFGFALYLLVLFVQVALLALSFGGSVQVGYTHLGSAFIGWILQFMITVHLIQRDSPYRVGVQWRTRPFKAAEMVAAKLLGVLAFVWFPPWLLGRGLLIVEGFSPAPGSILEPIDHLGILAMFAFLGLITPSLVMAILAVVGTCLALLIAYSLSSASFLKSLSETPGLLLIPPESAAAMCLVVLFLIAVASAYSRGSLARPLFGIAFGVLHLLSLGLYVFRPGEPMPPPAGHEDIVFRPNFERWSADLDAFSLGELTHRATDASSVVIVTDVQRNHPGEACCDKRVQFGTARRVGQDVSVPGLGFLRQVDEREPSPRIGPVGEGDLKEMRASDLRAELVVSYDVKRYEALGAIAASPGVSMRGAGWAMAVADVTAAGNGYPTREMTLTRQAGDLWAAEIYSDRSEMRVLTWRYLKESVASTLWPMGSGIQQISHTVLVFNPTIPQERGPDQFVLVKGILLATGERRFSLSEVLPPPQP